MEAEQKQRLLLSEDIPHPPKYPKSWSWRNSLTFVLLFFSLGANIFIFPVHILGQSGSSSPNRKHASQLKLHKAKQIAVGLRENVHDMQRWHSTVYSHPNETVRDEAWKAIDIDRSIVAVDHKEAAALGLPPTRIFPWDDGKGVYVLNVYHQFHCLVSFATFEFSFILTELTELYRNSFTQHCRKLAKKSHGVLNMCICYTVWIPCEETWNVWLTM